MATTPTASVREQRGSQKLLEHLAKNSEMPSVEEIKKALAIPAEMKVRIPNWLVRGRPPEYLELEGTLEVSVEHLADIVTRFVKLNDSTINLKILINGIPYPEIAQVTVRNTPGEE